MLEEIRISVAWGEQAKALCPFALDDQFLVDGEWLVSTRGEIIQHCPEEGYPDGVAYVSAALCEEETRKSFFRTINYGIDTLKGGMSTFYTFINKIDIHRESVARRKMYVDQYLAKGTFEIPTKLGQSIANEFEKYGIKTCLSKEDIEEIIWESEEEK